MPTPSASRSGSFVRYFYALLAGLLVSAAGVAGASPVVPASLRTPQQAAIDELIAPASDPAATGLSGAYQVINGRQALRAVFTDSVVRLSPQNRADFDWSVDSALAGFGIEGEMRPVGPGRAAPAGTRVSYSFSGLDAWIASAAGGIEQGFTIAAPPEGDNRKEPQVIRFAMHASGNLTGELAKDGHRLLFSGPDMQRAVSYSILRATDAAGQAVPAHLQYSNSEWPLRDFDLVVEGAEAEYPVQVALRIVTRAEDEPPPPALPEAPRLRVSEEGSTEDSGDEIASAQFVPPPNDTCAGASVIPAAGPFPYLTAITADITDATTAGDPAPMAGCPIGTPSPSRGIWYTWVPAASGSYTIATCADAGTASTVDDTILDVYTSSTSACGGVMTATACDDDGCTSENLQSVLTASFTAGTRYFIVVQKWDSTAPTAGNTAIQLKVTPLVAPPNDQCSGAIPLALNIPQKGTTAGGANDYTLSGAGCFALPTPPAPIGNTASTAPGRDVVYSYTALGAGSYSFRVKDYVGGNPVLYVVSACPPPSAVPTPPCLGAANRRPATAPFAEEVMCLPMAAGATVYAFVDDNTLTAGGSFTIEVNPCVRESEPTTTNNTPGTANPLFGTCGIEGSASPAGGEPDFYGLPGILAPNETVYTMVDDVANNTGDHEMRVTTATDTFEYDDDDGDSSFGLSGFEPVIAGTRVTPGGQAYIRVNPFSTTLLSEPYRLYQVVQPPVTAAVPEVEPNDPPSFNSAAPNYFSGVTSTTDQDDYAFNATAGDLIFVAADTDPDMNGTATDLTIGLFDPAGTLVVQVNGSTNVSTTRTPVPGLVGTGPVAPAEGLVYRAPVSGTYQAAVLAVAAGPGDYALSISKNCLPGGGGLGTTYTFPSTGLLVLELLPPFFPTPGPVVLHMRQNGPDSTVVDQPQAGDTIDKELVSLDLIGTLPNGGHVVTLRESPTRLSTGQTKVISPTEFDSFFDVFVEVQTESLNLFNDVAIRVQAKHNTLPPQDTQFDSPSASDVLLYDVSDPPPAGLPRARLRYAQHWVNPRFPPGQVDRKDTVLTANFQSLPPLPPFTASLQAGGDTVVRRNDPCVGCGPGGRTTIQTEMVSLNLTGNSPVLGPFQIQLNHDPGYPPTLGQLTSQSSTRAFPADAFFDVFFDFTSPQTGRLVTRPAQTGAAHVEATVAQGNPIGTIPCGAGQDLRQPQNQQTLLYRPSDLLNPVGILTNIIHTIDEPKDGPPLPPAGSDCFDSIVTARLTIFPPFHPGGCSETMVMNGPFKVQRSNPSDPGDGRDLIQTIMACYRFVGSSTAGGCGLGDVIAHPSETTPSTGQIRSLAAAENFPADSFFDVFPEIQVTGLGRLHTTSPTHMTSAIKSVPPGSGEIYFAPGVVIPLFNEANVQVGTIEVISHEIRSSIVCPCVCEPYLKVAPDKSTVSWRPVDANNLVLGGAGLQSDLMSGGVGPGTDWFSSFPSSTCLLPNGPNSYLDPAPRPPPGRLRWYVVRDGAFGANGTYNSCAFPPAVGNQAGNRDTEITASCP